jgi:hypothetical protein
VHFTPLKIPKAFFSNTEISPVCLFATNFLTVCTFVKSCTPNPLKCGGTGGCMGSVEPLAFTYASLFGVVTEEEYPYTRY